MHSTGALLDGRYRIDTLVAEGGMSRVYQGIDLSSGMSVAVKIL